jgi:RNA:NAD 2'-phosphotransferase (TPT1/KptA family)
MTTSYVKISKFLSLVLRHRPEEIGITLRDGGWVVVSDLLIAVGKRYGRPVLLIIASERMNKEGHLFYRSENGVWLTEYVPVAYIKFTDPPTRR